MLWYVMEKARCPYCNKEVEGFSQKQVDNFIRQHIISKHPDKVTFNGGKINKKTKGGDNE